MNETLSDRLDIADKIQEAKAQKENKRLERITKKVDKQVLKEFNKAQEFLGHRFTIKRNHSNMYSFWFEFEPHRYLHCYIGKCVTIKDPKWKFTEYCYSLHDSRSIYRDFKYKNKEFCTDKLSTVLIEFVTLFFREEQTNGR